MGESTNLRHSIIELCDVLDVDELRREKLLLNGIKTHYLCRSLKGSSTNLKVLEEIYNSKPLQRADLRAFLQTSALLLSNLHPDGWVTIKERGLTFPDQFRKFYSEFLTESGFEAHSLQYTEGEVHYTKRFLRIPYKRKTFWIALTDTLLVSFKAKYAPVVANYIMNNLGLLEDLTQFEAEPVMTAIVNCFQSIATIEGLVSESNDPKEVLMQYIYKSKFFFKADINLLINVEAADSSMQKAAAILNG